MKLYKRENYLKKIRGFYDATDIIKVITGVRRCGKSSFMLSIVDELLERNVPKENIIYIDLDKRGYQSITKAEQLDSLIFELSSNIKGTKYLFVDEVQNVEGFEIVLNGYRSEEEFSIFVTGSNSYLLSGELVTKLTGRYVEFELYTLSFQEYEAMKAFYNKPISPNPIEELSSYIIDGGFPRSIQFDSLQDRRTYSQNVIKEIFEKDIKRRIKIKDKDSFELVKTFIINNFASPFSINNIVEALIKNGNRITKVTVTKIYPSFIRC